MKEWSITHVAGFNGDYKAVQKVSYSHGRWRLRDEAECV